MARQVGTKNKPKLVEQLTEALSFVSIASGKTDAPYKEHVILNNKLAILSDGQLTAGFPIEEELESCPHLELLQKAIAKCGKTLALGELEGFLSVKGDKLTALVPCLPFTDIPDQKVILPDANIAKIDDRLKKAFEVCSTMINENGQRMIETALLLEANQCTGTDGKVLIQYWHGIDLPPNLVLPKIFVAAVCKVKSPLVGFGFTHERSATFWFENGAWLKTLLYQDKYPDVAHLLNANANPIDFGPEFFDAFKTVSEFNKEGCASFEGSQIVSYKGELVGANFETDRKFNSNQTFDWEVIKCIEKSATKIDFSSYIDRAFFFGENTRGVILPIIARQPVKVEQITDEEIPF